jgi:hypothetical protein
MEHKFITISSRKIIGCFSSAARQSLIAAALLTNAGKMALANAMAAPIRQQLNYAGLARRIFNVQQLPQGAPSYLPSNLTEGKVSLVESLFIPYKHDSIIITPYKVIGRAGRIIRGKRVTIPTFELVSNPTVKISDVKSRRFNIIDRYTREAHGQVIIRPNKRIGLWNKIGAGGLLDNVVKKARDEIMAQEDAEIFRILENVAADGK